MEKLKQGLIQKAKSKYGTIYPCGNTELFSDCFTKYNKKVQFWFNTEDESTHLVEESMCVDSEVVCVN